MDRREFVRLCAGTAVAAACWRGAPAFAEAAADFAPARLVKADGTPLQAAEVGTAEAMVFAYPYRGIPCFLVNLGKRMARPVALTSPDDGDYTSPPGVGPHANLVAFVAICTHQLSYPKPADSMIRYAAAGSPTAGAPGRIVCCTHGSVFDPAAGGVRISGPAPNPLLPVRLAHDAATNGLTATGSVGDQFFERFFRTYKPDLIDRFGPGGYRQPVGDTTPAVPLGEYSALVPAC
ncbi:MAG TPA: Rieske (2Fe-2S) protein [Rhodanobacteraceae bacterium]|nr:Rieske (2Fe-2S) protein [Rhodanobacteraceae bacterium]